MAQRNGVQPSYRSSSIRIAKTSTGRLRSAGASVRAAATLIHSWSPEGCNPTRSWLLFRIGIRQTVSMFRGRFTLIKL